MKWFERKAIEFADNITNGKDVNITYFLVQQAFLSGMREFKEEMVAMSKKSPMITHLQIEDLWEAEDARIPKSNKR